MKTYFGPLGQPGGQTGNTVSSYTFAAGQGWSPEAIDRANRYNFVLGGFSGQTATLHPWTGSIYELQIFEGADSDATAMDRIVALAAKWSAM